MAENKKKKVRQYGVFFTPPMVVSLIIFSIILLAVIFAPLIAPCDPNAMDLKAMLKGPSLEHFMGTDNSGRDVFSRLLYGGRTTLINAVLVVLISVVVGIPLGLMCGYFGGRFDALVMRVWDVVLCFPSLLLSFIFVAAFGKGQYTAVLAMGIVYIPMISKLSRSLAMTESTKTYVELAHSLGYSDWRIIFVHILPNCLPTMLAELTLDVGSAIKGLASLSFLGLGVQPPTSDWGSMLQEGLALIQRTPYVALAPSITIVLTVISINVLSDNIQMYFDPTQRKLPSLKKLEKLEKFNVKETEANG